MKKIVIEAILVEEADSYSNEKIIKDIEGDLSKYPPRLSWIQALVRITIE